MTRAAALFLLVVGACIPGDGPMMKPFQDCTGCHSSSGNAKAWTVAGTWRKGVTVSVTDANGKTVDVHGNDAGNFYTREPLAFPLTVAVDGALMKDSGTGATIALYYGGCNACHHAETITTGPEMAPGAPCLTCHGVGGMAVTPQYPAFTAAGTFSPNTSVRVGNQTGTTNAVGNFYFTAPIQFPGAAAQIGGSSMEGGAPHGDCNQCHGGGRAGGD
jgi:hypothetical protein